MTADERQADYERVQKMLARHVAAIGEHFENVQILVSRQNGDATQFHDRGSGNILARVEQCRQFVRETQRLMHEDRDDDDDEDN